MTRTPGPVRRGFVRRGSGALADGLWSGHGLIARRLAGAAIRLESDPGAAIEAVVAGSQVTDDLMGDIGQRALAGQGSHRGGGRSGRSRAHRGSARPVLASPS